MDFDKPRKLTKAKRITNVAGNIPVMEFGARRARGIDSAVNNMFSGQADDVKATTSQVTKGKELYKAWLEAPKDQKAAKQKAFNDFYNTCSSNATVRLLYNEVNKKTTT